jgi:hypothetical protein
MIRVVVPGGGIANGGCGRFRQINQIRALIEYNKLSGISTLSSVSTETIAAIGFRQTWTPTRIWGAIFWTPIVLCERAAPANARYHYSIVKPEDGLLQVLWELGSTLVAVLRRNFERRFDRDFDR